MSKLLPRKWPEKRLEFIELIACTPKHADQLATLKQKKGIKRTKNRCLDWKKKRRPNRRRWMPCHIVYASLKPNGSGHWDGNDKPRLIKRARPLYPPVGKTYRCLACHTGEQFLCGGRSGYAGCRRLDVGWLGAMGADRGKLLLNIGDTGMTTRRAFLKCGFNASASLALAPYAVGLPNDSPLLTIKLIDRAPVRVPSNFTGLGYEMSSVAPIGLLSQTNHRYVNLIKGLGSNGVVRVGGIVADYTRYEPDGTIIADRQNTVLTNASLEQFATFLEKTGWVAIWSVNFAQGSLQDAVEEATAVSSILSSRLMAIELGNEVENYSRGQRPFRKAPYDYESYRKEYNEWRAAILRAAPHIKFAAPDTATSVEWVERMAADAKGDVQLLTTHYYRNGQARGSIEQLLLPDPRLEDILGRLRIASHRSGIPWRMCETNSFSGGGRPGVSDSFVGALWLLDYMLLLARYGCAGVNVETGVNQLGFISSYSPIQDNGHGINTAGVPYYAMLAFSLAMVGCREILLSSLDAQGTNVTGYVLGDHGRPKVLVVVNRDSRDIDLSIQELKMRDGSVLRMCSPAPESKSDITLGGSLVDRDGGWIAKDRESLIGHTVRVPKMSAAILRSE